MRIDRFCTQLQAGANVPTITESEAGEISCPVSLPSNYVMPNIAPGTLVPAARVILIEAPGAVGKSMAARAMAAMLGWPLVLSNRAQVGSYTLTGMLQDRMGFDSDFLPSLARGETGIVIDAIDEAHLRAGTNNLLAFLEDVKRLTPPREAMASPSIIILGRVDAIDLVSLAMDEMNVPYDRQRLAYFGRREATDFVREYLKLRADETGQPEYRTAQASPTPFEKLLHQRMQEVGSLLVPGVDVVNAWGTVEDFLGYAPVLMAIAESVAVKNPSAKAERVFRGSQLLREIVEYILEREHSKVVEALAKKLQSKLSIGAPEEGLELLYRPDEQVARIVEETRMGRSLVTLPATLSDGVRREYEEAIQSFLPDHPFLRRRSFSSTVFSDYVLSWCQAPAGQLMIEPGPTPPKVGAFFAMFMSADDDQPSVIAESTVPQLLASWSEQCAVKGVAGHSVLIGSPEGQLDVLLFEIEGKGAEPNSGFRFTVPEFSGALALSGALKNLSIFGDFGVILGDPGQELIAGPDVFIGVTDIEILAESITVNSTKSRRGAILVGSNGVSAHQLTEVRGQSGSLSISCPVVPPHLYEHRYAGGLEGWPFPDLEWFIDLKAVLLSFGQSVAGRPAVFEEKMDKAIVGARPRRAAILSDLMDKRVVAKDGRLYRLDLSRLSELGFGLRDVVSGEPSPEVTAYLVSLARA